MSQHLYIIRNVGQYQLIHDNEMKVLGDDVYDEYHSMEELYEHRYRLFLALLKAYDSYIPPLTNKHILCWKSKLHDDGTMFPNMFIAGMKITRLYDVYDWEQEIKYITYHLPNKHWDICNVVEYPKAPKYDGHTSVDVLQQLLEL